MKYIVILEGEAPRVAIAISEDDCAACDEGIIEEIIDLENGTHYVSGMWVKMRDWNS